MLVVNAESSAKPLSTVYRRYVFPLPSLSTSAESYVPGRPKRPKGFGEIQRPFSGTVGFGDLFAAYDFACAFTGVDLTAEAQADPRGSLLVIGADHATDDPTRLIPACLDAIHAYERGHLTLGARYNFLADLQRISPEFLDTLNASGHLTLPKARSLRPSQDTLAAHRAAFSAGTFPAD